MRLDGPPRPWHAVAVGAVVLLHPDPVARTVLQNVAGFAPHVRALLLEGLAPMVGHADAMVQVVVLDETDAMLNMFSAGLEPVVLDVKES